MNKKGFTFIELVVSITILIILSWIWYASYTDYLSNARDSQRSSDLTQITSALKVYKQKRGYYPIPWNFFNIQYDWETVATQWFFDTNVRLTTLDRIISDPKIHTPYTFSITENKQEFEISATLENWNEPTAILNWNYKSVSVNILPTISLAIKATPWSDIEIKEWTSTADENRKKFIYNSQYHNLPYSFNEPYLPFSLETDFNMLLTKQTDANYYWQNTDFRNCLEIEEAWKELLPFTNTAFEYQIMSSTWALTNTGCTQ